MVFDDKGDCIEGGKPEEPEPDPEPNKKKKKEKEPLPPRHGAASPFGRFATLNSYKGEMRMGVREGVGRFYYANGASYTGAWSNNEKGEGDGVQILKAFFPDTPTARPVTSPPGMVGRLAAQGPL